MPARARLLVTAAVVGLVASLVPVVRPAHSTEAAPVEITSEPTDHVVAIEL
ncbi:MAG: hypothetical protein AAGC63_05035 [Propionicimonas sp.]|nr:hypothetical protein [Propionicimonas sp.]